MVPPVITQDQRIEDSNVGNFGVANVAAETRG